MEKKKAVGLISGGLDSVIAIKLMQEQNFEVIGVYILTPFISGFGEKQIKNLKRIEKEMGFKLRIIEVGDDYFEIVKNPEFGYGKNLNPCIDCRIYMLKIGKRIMEEEGAEFVFTGEVLNQRGKSQTINSLKIIEEKSSLKGKLLRPLSALHLPESDVEKEGIVDRNKLLGIKGKERKIQFYIAFEKGLKYFETPSGGCLLTDPQYCKRLKDLFIHKEKPSKKDFLLLQIGRHFRISQDTKLIIPRNEMERKRMENFIENHDILITDENSQLLGLLKGKLEELAFQIVSAYDRKKRIYLAKYPDGRVIEKRIVGKENKIFFHKFLI